MKKQWRPKEKTSSEALCFTLFLLFLIPYMNIF